MSSYNLEQIIFNCNQENFKVLVDYVKRAKEDSFPTMWGWRHDLALEKLTGRPIAGIKTSLALNLAKEYKQPQLFEWIDKRRIAEEEEERRIAEEQYRKHRKQLIRERKAKPFEQRVIEWRDAKRKRVAQYERKQREWNEAPSVYFSSFADFDENWNPVYTLKVGKSNNHPNTRTKNWGKLIVSIPWAIEGEVHTWLAKHLPKITLDHGREGGNELYGHFESGIELCEAGKYFAGLYAKENNLELRYG